MQSKDEFKYIILTVLKRLLIYTAITVISCGIAISEINSIRNKLYGIGNYVNSRAIAGMLIAFSDVFFFIYMLFLFYTKKHLYTTENIKSGNLKEYLKFEVILELAITLGYIIISSVAAIFVKDAGIAAGLLVPMYFIYSFTENMLVSIAITVVICLLMLFLILILPYFKLSSKNKK